MSNYLAQASMAQIRAELVNLGKKIDSAKYAKVEDFLYADLRDAKQIVDRLIRLIDEEEDNDIP